METPDRDLQELLQELDPTSQFLYSEAIAGRDAEDFIRSDLGKIIVGMARQDYVDAVLRLSETPWWRKGRFRALQAKSANAKAFLGYLYELVVRGRQVQHALEEKSDAT